MPMLMLSMSDFGRSRLSIPTDIPKLSNPVDHNRRTRVSVGLWATCHLETTRLPGRCMCPFFCTSFGVELLVKKTPNQPKCWTSSMEAPATM